MDNLRRFAARTLIGSAVGGTGASPTRVDLACGRFGGPLEEAWLTALTRPPGDSVTAVVELRPGLPVRPATLLASPPSVQPAVATLIKGPGQAAVAAAVVKAVDDGTLPRAEIDDVLLVVRLDLGETSDAPDQVFANVLAATRDALLAAVHEKPTIDEVLAEAGHPWNADYHRHRN
jgi:formaldehyde-activating enzyme